MSQLLEVLTRKAQLPAKEYRCHHYHIQGWKYPAQSHLQKMADKKIASFQFLKRLTANEVSRNNQKYIDSNESVLEYANLKMKADDNDHGKRLGNTD